MSGDITVPAYIAGFQALETTPEAIETLATDLRAVTVDVKNAHSCAGPLADPGWQGDAAEAHAHAATRFFLRLDVVDAALDKAVTAADRFEERISRLKMRRDSLESQRLQVNADTSELVTQIQAAVDDSQEAAFRQRAADLVTRADALNTHISTWTSDYLDAESDFIAALQGVDTLAEGRSAASDPGRPDTTALGRKMRSLLGNPKALAAWWASLTRAQREALTTEDPALVGNADGVPTRDRDEANRAALDADLDYLNKRSKDGELVGNERNELDNATAVARALGDYRNKVDPLTGRELAYLMVFKPDAYTGDGGVAVSLGDPDLADNVSTMVPGFNSKTSSLGDYMDRNQALYTAAAADKNGSVATVFWLDYDAPNFSGSPSGIVDGLMVATPVEAAIGGHRLADFIDGLHATDQGPAAHLTAIGHSYGSTTLGYALVDGARVDDTVLVGSPGQPVANASMFPHAGHVWVGAQDHDGVSLLGQTLAPRGDSLTSLTGTLGYDPAQSTFGGTRIETGDGSLRIEDVFSKNHSSYFQGQSLDNMSHIVSGDTGDVDTRDGRHGYDYMSLPELLGVAGANSAGHEIWDGTVDTVKEIGSIPGKLVGLANPMNW